MLRLSDLHEVYTTVSMEEAKAMANLGAHCWIAFKDGLYNHWASSMSAEDTEKAEAWRQEGRLSAMESLKSKFVAAETAIAQTAEAEGRVATIKASMEMMKTTMETEIERKVQDKLELQRKSLEIEHLIEMSGVKERLAFLSSIEPSITILQSTNATLTKAVLERDGLIAEKEAQLQSIVESQKTKSSYAIGKQGEAVVMDILHKYVLPVFIHSSAYDVTGKGHVADIHLFLQSPVGKMMKILVEAKQYSRPVKTKEITKLHNDVDADDEALAGIMISNSSQISSVKQFQIEKTSKGKYVLYLSVEGYDDEFRGMIVCWAIRVLSTLATYSAECGDDLVGKVVDFFGELEKSVQEADQVVKNCQKAVDSAILMKRGLIKKLEDFRRDNLKMHALTNIPSSPTTQVKEEFIKEELAIEMPDDKQSIASSTKKLTSGQKYYVENRERLLAYAREARRKKREMKK